MTGIAIAALVVVCMVQTGLIVYLLRHSASRERDWTLERQLLISRVQHPGIVHRPDEALVSPTSREDPPGPSEEEDESGLVGRVIPGAGD